MTKVDFTSPLLNNPTAAHPDFAPGGRLIVLVPVDADYSAATRPIWELANASKSSVQFIGLCKDTAQEATLRRQLVTMSTMVQDAKVHAEAWIVIGKDWVSAVKSDLQDGDMIVCFAEQHTGLLHRPLSQILESNLRLPVYVLSGLPTQRRGRTGWLSQIAAWTGSLGIIAGSTLFQIQLVSLPGAGTQTTLMILSVIAEAWLIWVWNGLFG